MDANSEGTILVGIKEHSQFPERFILVVNGSEVLKLEFLDSLCGRLTAEDMLRLSSAIGIQLVTSLNDLFSEREVSDDDLQ